MNDPGVVLATIFPETQETVSEKRQQQSYASLPQYH